MLKLKIHFVCAAVNQPTWNKKKKRKKQMKIKIRARENKADSRKGKKTHLQNKLSLQKVIFPVYIYTIFFISLFFFRSQPRRRTLYLLKVRFVQHTIIRMCKARMIIMVAIVRHCGMMIEAHFLLFPKPTKKYYLCHCNTNSLVIPYSN